MQGNEEADGAVLWSDCKSWRRGRRGRREEEVRWEKKRAREDEVGVRLSMRKPLDAEASPCGGLEKERTN